MCKSYHLSKSNNQSNSFAGWRVIFYYIHVLVLLANESFWWKMFFLMKWTILLSWHIQSCVKPSNHQDGISLNMLLYIINLEEWNWVDQLDFRHVVFKEFTDVFSLQKGKWNLKDCNSRQIKHLEGCFWRGSWMVSCRCHLIMVFETSKRGRNRGKLIRLDDLTTFGQT